MSCDIFEALSARRARSAPPLDFGDAFGSAFEAPKDSYVGGPRCLRVDRVELHERTDHLDSTWNSYADVSHKFTKYYV